VTTSIIVQFRYWLEGLPNSNFRASRLSLAA